MLSFIILLRLRQAYRYSQELGFVRTLILGLTTVIFLPRFVLELWMNNPYYLAAFWGVVLLSIHLQRADDGFLKSIAIRHTHLYTIEYGILSVAFIGLYLQQQYWWGALALSIQVILLPHLPRFWGRSKGKRQYWWDTKHWLPSLHFEWIAGIRQRFIHLFTIWFLGLLFCWYAPVAPVVSLLLGMMIPSFYLVCESNGRGIGQLSSRVDPMENQTSIETVWVIYCSFVGRFFVVQSSSMVCDTHCRADCEFMAGIGGFGKICGLRSRRTTYPKQHIDGVGHHIYLLTSI